MPFSESRSNLGFGRLATFVGCCFVVWLVLYAVWITFPYVRNGTRCIQDAKRERLVRGSLFAAAENRYRLLVMGDSRVLSGFLPARFDELSGGRVSSYNLGLPAEKEFLTLLESALEAGNIPTHVFSINCWEMQDFHPTPWKWVKSDKRLMATLFPFRGFPRDAAAFFRSARKEGGLAARYEATRRTVDNMLAERGFYFIEFASMYPNDRLPDDYSNPSDTPTEVESRLVRTEGSQFQRLRELADRYEFDVYLIPVHFRDRNRAEPPATNEETQKAIAGYPRFHLLGPDYIRYPNRAYADPVHMNREGAAAYTDDLWNLSSDLFSKSPPSLGGTSGSHDQEGG